MYNFIFVTEDKLGTYMYIYVPSIYIVRSVLNYRQWLCGGRRGHFSEFQVFFRAKTPNLCIILACRSVDVKKTYLGSFLPPGVQGRQKAVGGGKKEAYLFSFFATNKNNCGRHTGTFCHCLQ